MSYNYCKIDAYIPRKTASEFMYNILYVLRYCINKVWCTNIITKK